MCTREMTLGEEIISLTGKGVDISTVERMYRKYIAIISVADTKKVTEELYHVDVNALFPTIESIFGKVYSILPDDIAIGDQIEIPLGNLGTFTATVQMVKDDKVLFLFDDYIVKRPMNENGSNEGGYEKSDLKKWIENELFKMFPKALRKHMTGLTIPTLGEIYGWGDNWDKEHMDSFHAGNQFTDRCCFHCIGSNRNTGKDSAEESCCKQNEEIQYSRKVRQNINLNSIKSRKHSNIAHSFCTLFRGKQQYSRNRTKNKADQPHSFSACSTHDKNAYDEDEQQFCTRIEP